MILTRASLCIKDSSFTVDINQAPLMPMPIILTTPLFRIKFNKRINTHNSHTSLNSTLELLNLTHAGLQHSHLERINNPSFAEI